MLPVVHQSLSDKIYLEVKLLQVVQLAKYFWSIQTSHLRLIIAVCVITTNEYVLELHKHSIGPQFLSGSS